MIDIHTHILPQVDDGAKSWEMAAEMCRVAANDGITHIVATPHANDEYEYDRPALEQALQRLQGVAGEWPTLLLGCDFHFSYDNVQAALGDPGRFAIGRTGYLLVEFSDFAISPAIGAAVHRLRGAGLTPIVTHPERNAILQRTPQHVLQLIGMGCLVQLTASSLTGFWGEPARKTAEWLLQHQAVHLLASDAHDPVRRPPVLSQGRNAAARLRGPEVAKALVEDNPRAVIAGEPLPYCPVLTPKK